MFSTVEKKVIVNMLSYFYDDYTGNTMLKTGMETFAEWYGDKVYREFGVVAEIQQELVLVLTEEIIRRLDKAHDSEYGSAHPEWQQGVRAAMKEVKELFCEIDEKDLAAEEDNDRD